MLTKETKQKTSEMMQELAPLFAIVTKLGQKLSKQASQTRHAHNVATAWQYPTCEGYANECGEDTQTIQKTRNETPEKWHEILNKKYEILNECEQLEKVARLNYRNYAAFLCSSIAYYLHQGDTWAKFYEKKGIETLAQELKTLCGKYEGVYISRDGTAWETFGDKNFYCYFKICFYGIGNTRANDWATYRELAKQENPHEWEKPTAPKIYTLKQYIKLVSELKELENQAKAKAREHHEKARASGLIYFTGGLSDPQINVWGKND